MICELCHQESPIIKKHYIIPLKKGGGYSAENVMRVCLKDLEDLKTGLAKPTKPGAMNEHKYETDISNRLTDTLVRQIYDKAKTKEEQVLVSLLWTTGARPSELCELIKEDITLKTDSISFRLNTKKTNATGERFVLKERLLEFERPQGLQLNIYLETIASWVESLGPGQRLIKYGTRWVELGITRITQQALGAPYCPYHFRHSSMCRESALGRTTDQLMHFKGAKSRRSVEPYIHASPYKIALPKEEK